MKCPKCNQPFTLNNELTDKVFLFKCKSCNMLLRCSNQNISINTMSNDEIAEKIGLLDFTKLIS
jgi:hypothetical protein